MWSLMPVFEGCRSQGKWCGSPAPKSPHNRGQKITFSRSEEAPHALQAGAQCGATGDEEGSNPTHRLDLHPTARAVWTLHKLNSNSLRPFQPVAANMHNIGSEGAFLCITKKCLIKK